MHFCLLRKSCVPAAKAAGEARVVITQGRRDGVEKLFSGRFEFRVYFEIFRKLPPVFGALRKRRKTKTRERRVRAEPVSAGKEGGALGENDPMWTDGTEQEFMASLPSGVCPECGNPVYQNARGRKKIFCSEACRFAFKNKHPKPENWKSTRKAVCPVCGKEFLASREYGGMQRKYCSIACSNRGRARKRKEECLKQS